MSKIEVNYDDLSGKPAEYQNSLKDHEDTVREAVAAIGRSCSVRWMLAGEENSPLLRLTAYSNRDDTIAEVTPLDLTLDAEKFKEKIVLANT